MARIKVPEFKVGDKVDPDKFNEAFSAFRRENLILDGDNFADESLGIDQIPENISLTDTSKIHRATFEVDSAMILGNTDSASDPWRNSITSFSGMRRQGLNHPGINRVTINNLSVGDQFIIRASCCIQTTDGGWRTFMFGVPPIVKIGLYRFDGEGVSAADFPIGGSSNPNSFPLHETLAHYRIAFTGKVPSSSSLNKAVRLNAMLTGAILEYRSRDDYGVELTHRDTRRDPDTDTYGDIVGAIGAPFNGYHSYTTAYLYTHSASNSSSQSFGIMCSEEGGKVGYRPDGSGRGDSTRGGTSGCEEPKHQSFTIKDLNVFVYEVKK